MCGLFGIVYKDGKTLPSQRLLQESAELLSHRGPDGSGLYHEPGLGLAHTRLSLIDLDQRSNQPFWDAEGNHCIVYNGEVYNFQEIKEELVGRGARFRTTSDTEVILTSLIMDGPQATLQRLRGMFAFAFYDRRKRRLILARDRFGIKPLLIYRTADRILFASEVKAMRPWAPLAPNPLYVISYLINLTEATRSRSIFQNIDIVPPGSMITINLDGGEESTVLLDLTQMVDPEQARGLDKLDEKAVIDRVDELLHESVKNMLVADAPVGALCSGGVDSSLLTAIATKYHSNLAIFHADVVGHSEFEAASLVAKHLKLDLKKTTTRDRDFIDLTPKIIYHYEWPYAWHPHSVPFLMVSQLVQQHKVKAVITGEGADESFLGYPYLAQKPFWEAYANLRRRLRSLVHRIPRVGPYLWSEEGEHALFIGTALKQFERRMDYQRIGAAYSSRLHAPRDRNVTTVEQLSSHLRTLLHRNDRMGMAASIEARFPFLDEALVGEAINLPYRHKLRVSATAWDRSHPLIQDKWALRQLADRYLPRELSRRKKQGFTVSGLSRVVVEPDYFRDGFVPEFLQMREDEFEYFYGAETQPMKIKLMMLEVWGQMFIRDQSLPAVAAQLDAHASLRQPAS